LFLIFLSFLATVGSCLKWEDDLDPFLNVDLTLTDIEMCFIIIIILGQPPPSQID